MLQCRLLVRSAAARRRAHAIAAVATPPAPPSRPPPRGCRLQHTQHVELPLTETPVPPTPHRFSSAPTKPRRPVDSSRRSEDADPFAMEMQSPRMVLPPDFQGFEAALAAGDRVPAWLKFQDIVVDEASRAQLRLDHFIELMDLLIAHSPPKMEFAIQVLGMLRQQGFKPTTDAYNILMKGYARMGDLEGSRNVLKRLGESGLQPNMVTYNLFMRMYVKAGKLDAAIAFFDRMLAEDLAPDVDSFNVLIDGAGQAGRADLAWRYYQNMLDLAYDPNERTFSLLIKMHVRHTDMETAEKWLSDMRARGLKPDLFDYTTLMGGFSRAGNMEKVQQYFDELLADNLVPDQATYNTVIHAKAVQGDINGAMAVVDAMVRDHQVAPDAITYQTLIHAFCEAGRPLDAERLLVELKKSQARRAKQILPGVYRSIITAYAKKGETDDATRLILQMEDQDGFPASRACYNVVLEAAAKRFDIDLIDTFWERLRYPTNTGLFANSPADIANAPNEITYGIVIEAMTVANRIDRALEVWRDMSQQGLEPSFELYSGLIRTLIRARMYARAASVLAVMRRSKSESNAERPLGKTFDDFRDQFSKLALESGAALEAMPERPAGAKPLVVDRAKNSAEDQEMARLVEVVLALYKELTTLQTPAATVTATAPIPSATCVAPDGTTHDGTSSAAAEPPAVQAAPAARTIDVDIYRFAMEAHRRRGDPLNMVVVFMALQNYLAATPDPIVPARAVSTLLRGLRDLAKPNTARAAVDMLTAHNIHKREFSLDRAAYIHLLHLEARTAQSDRMLATVVDMRNEGHELARADHLEILQTFVVARRTGSGSAAFKTACNAARAEWVEFVKEMLPHLLETEDGVVEAEEEEEERMDWGRDLRALIP
ncbi:hypothetical protein HDU87_006572 [Geranomyces variabilis]|uniref:Pentacotripeptide-repeat region of PRORP domain-containing protein n=1 Tax=Geranomyces variabilis TaxID=109894 RepID=A0AAD5TF11_9FUNG|nr:hypothetical protein HDU87_006572 [Geranomyces variabilis]